MGRADLGETSFLGRRGRLMLGEQNSVVERRR